MASSPINIALVKYWGKIHEELIIPANSSLSITIDKQELNSTTQVILLDKEQEQQDQFELILNGKKDKISERMKRVFSEIMQRVAEYIYAYDCESQNVTEFQKEDIRSRKVKIISNNNFATASGLASSSSGLSCLSFALAKLYGAAENFESEYSIFARLGSGSACRSLYGGFVEWQKGFDHIEDVYFKANSANFEEISKKSISKQLEIS